MPSNAFGAEKAPSIKKLLDKTSKLLDDGKYSEAIKYFDKVLKIDPQNIEALHDKGFALMELGKHKEAIRYFNKILKIDPKYIDAYYNKGVSLYELGKQSEALKTFEKNLKLNPKDVDALNYKGIILCDNGKYNEAIVQFDKILKIDAIHVDALYNKGLCLIQLGRNDEALTYFDIVLELEPDDGNALYQKQLLLDYYNNQAQNELSQYGAPKTTIAHGKINWEFKDSKGNDYFWGLPVDDYEYKVRLAEPYEFFYFQMPDGNTITVIDHTKFVEQSFNDVIDDIYDNSHDDMDFIYEIWYLASQMTIYSYEIEEYPRYALETFSRGAGDCEDTSILIADMLKSSRHTRNWKIQLVYFDADNPTRAIDVDHVAVFVDTGEFSTIIESTAKTIEGANAWNQYELFGWWHDV